MSYSDETDVSPLTELDAEEIVRHYVLVQELLESKTSDHFSVTYFDIEEKIMDEKPEFGEKLIRAFMASDNIHARLHLVNMYDYIGAKFALECLEKLADDPSLEVLESLQENLTLVLRDDPFDWADFRLFLGIIPILDKVTTRIKSMSAKKRSRLAE